MNLSQQLQQSVTEAVKKLYHAEVASTEILISETKKDFEGDVTFTVFPLTKISRKSPELTGNEIGEELRKTNPELISKFNVIKGFLNISIDDSYWKKFFGAVSADEQFGFVPLSEKSPQVMVEYSSPNTNKPLHLGHIRNILLGHSVSQILHANGNRVVKVNLVNDRGIHICKSMLAWKKWGNGETPQSSGEKGDKLVGKYYVLFDVHLKSQISRLISEGQTETDAEKNAPLIKEVQEMLRHWEAGDTETIELWKMMNHWVYEGFDFTYKKLGVDFDNTYYESETYLLGKKIVDEGLSKKIFYKKDDGSVWIDLTDVGLDEKVLLRSDGTSVYITQDIGTAQLRFSNYPEAEKLIYVVGNEQDYHFKVLKEIIHRLKHPRADGLFHLSYGMVDLPSGKMKSREGTVVDADDLIDEMDATAKKMTQELGKVETLTEEEAEKLYHTLGMGALKYFILKVDPKKRMLFNPAESIDFNGNTGPFIQYTHARICSVLRKGKNIPERKSEAEIPALNKEEKEIIKLIHRFPLVVKEAAEQLSPASVANYVYELAKAFNHFYHEHTIADEGNPAQSMFRLRLSKITASVIRKSLILLGIEAPEKM
jgi:arginyl-tRNA synthetase